MLVLQSTVREVDMNTTSTVLQYVDTRACTPVLLLSDETLSENALKINEKQKASLPLSLQLTTIATCKKDTDWKVK